ncbi:hypothetical protein GCM10028798_32200 [Humibacter antri]
MLTETESVVTVASASVGEMKVAVPVNAFAVPDMAHVGKVPIVPGGTADACVIPNPTLAAHTTATASTFPPKRMASNILAISRSANPGIHANA